MLFIVSILCILATHVSLQKDGRLGYFYFRVARVDVLLWYPRPAVVWGPSFLCIIRVDGWGGGGGKGMEKGWIMYNFSSGIPSYFLRFNNMPSKRRKTPDLCNHSFLALVPLEFAFAKVQFASSQLISVDLLSSMCQIKWGHLIACSLFNPDDTGKET